MRKSISCFILLALLFAANSFAGISVDHDKSTDFSSFKSFKIVEASKAVNPLMRERLVKAIEEGLVAGGLTKVEKGADLLVIIHASVGTEIHITSDTWGYGGYRGWGGWGGWGTTTVDVEKVAVGTLMLDMVDAEKDKLVWRGIATDSIPKKTEKQEKMIYKAVNKLFKHFPPEE
jgi:hypothetical protein